MDRLARAFPVLPGKTAAMRGFAQRVRNRRGDIDTFYRTYGVGRETWHLQERVGGDLVICCTDLADLGPAASAYAAAEKPFDTWFKRQVLELCGIDANKEPKGPPSVLLFDWPLAP